MRSVADIKALIQGLRADALDERDRACAELRVAPPQAVAEALRSLLKGLSKTSGDTQARTLYAFRGAQLHHQRRVVNSEPVTHDFRYSGKAVRAYYEIGRLTDAPIRIRTAKVPNDVHVEVDLHQATLLEMLDRVSMAAGLRWQADRYGVLRVEPAEVTTRRPASYAGPSRVRMHALSCERTTDFTNPDTMRLSFGLDVDFEWPIRPMVPPTVQMRSLRIGDVEAKVVTEASSGTRADASFRCSSAGLPAVSGSIERITGELACAFNSGFEEVSLDDPEVGTTIATKSFELCIDEIFDDGYLLTLAAVGVSGDQLTQGMLGCAVSTTILGIDDKGVEALAKVRTLQAVAPGQKRKQIRLRLAFVRYSFGRPKHLRLRLARGILLELYPIELEGVALP
jgi:hypothetical protein